MPASTIPASQFDSIPDTIEAFRKSHTSQNTTFNPETEAEEKKTNHFFSLLQAAENSSSSSTTPAAKMKPTSL